MDKFNELYEAILTNSDAAMFDLCELAEAVGIDQEVAYKLINAAMAVKKAQIVKEVKKQTESMVYWVERN
jgi:soluble P-type ATPase